MGQVSCGRTKLLYSSSARRIHAILHTQEMKIIKYPGTRVKSYLVYIFNSPFSILIFKTTKLSEIWDRGLKSGRRANMDCPK